MSRRFENKVAIVTGATSGIGEATALLFGSYGATVVVAARRSDRGEALAERIRMTGGSAAFIHTDVTIPASVAHLMEETERRFGRLDFAFNNAGIGGPPLLDIFSQTEEAWDSVINTNLRGVWLCMKYELPMMRRQGVGAIVNTASIYAHVGSDLGISPYVASKHGVLGLTRAASIELAKCGVRINAVSPGATRTEMTMPALEAHPESFNAAIQRDVPMGRIAEPAEIAEAVVWLCSPEASYITGHSLIVDGGWHTH